MGDIIFLISFIILLIVIKRYKFFSPISIYTIIAFFNILIFYLIYFYGISSPLLEKNWLITNDFSQTATKSMALYLLLYMPSIISLFLFKKIESKKKIKKQIVYKRKIVVSRSKIILFLIILLVLTIAYSYHCYFVNWKLLIKNNDFAITRDPRNIGFLNDSLGILIHNLLKILTVVLGGFIGYFITRKNFMMATLLVPYYIYGLFVLMGATSRWSSLAVFSLILFLIFKTSNKLINIFLILIGSIHFLMIISIRGFKNYGLSSLFFNFADIFMIGFSNLIFILSTAFNGVFVFAESLKMGPLNYPLAYKILSFSPFPSFIDGFHNYLKYEYRVAFFKPFNNIAEAYHFGILYFIFYLFMITFFILFYMKVYLNISKKKSIVAFIPAYIAFLNMHLYPIRHSFKFFIISFFISYYFYKKEKRIKNNG